MLTVSPLNILLQVLEMNSQQTSQTHVCMDSGGKLSRRLGVRGVVFERSVHRTLGKQRALTLRLSWETQE